MNIEDEFHKLLEACNPALIAIWGTGQIEAQLEVLMTEYERLHLIELAWIDLGNVLAAKNE